VDCGQIAEAETVRAAVDIMRPVLDHRELSPPKGAPKGMARKSKQFHALRSTRRQSRRRHRRGRLATVPALKRQPAPTPHRSHAARLRGVEEGVAVAVGSAGDPCVCDRTMHAHLPRARSNLAGNPRGSPHGLDPRQAKPSGTSRIRSSRRRPPGTRKPLAQRSTRSSASWGGKTHFPPQLW
jgi:hypothetical protein